MKLKKKILVIEDDENLGNLIHSILTLQNYDVCYANNGASGIQKAFEYNPDLILSDISMIPVDGYQVYKVLEESSLLNRVPFIFLTGNSELEEIRFGMNLGADDYLVKPFENDDLIISIEKRLKKFQSIRDEASREFKQIFDLSPFGLLIFDEKQIYKTNQAFNDLISCSVDELTGTQLENLFEPKSFQKLIVQIQEYAPVKNEIFNDVVTLISCTGNPLQIKLEVSEFRKFSNHTLYIGLFITLSITSISFNSQLFADRMYALLRRENILISEALGEKIINVFKQNVINMDHQNTSFFTRRESQVLCLAMEGLPIKTIADRLAISDRTVEKHRTRLMEKSGSNNMIEVIVFALKNSLVKI